LDADLLRRSGLDPDLEIEAMRYAQQERRTRKDGSVAIRARVVLNLRMIPKQEAGPMTEGLREIVVELLSEACTHCGKDTSGDPSRVETWDARMEATIAYTHQYCYFRRIPEARRELRAAYKEMVKDDRD